MRQFLLSLGLACALGVPAAHAQTPTWQWGAQSINPTPTNATQARAYSIATDAAGNSYVGGGLQERDGVSSVRTFGSTRLSSATISGVVGKLNAAGQWQWATAIEAQDANGTNNTVVFLGDIVPTPAGDVFVTGTVDEDATSMRIGTVTLPLTGSNLEQRMFVARLNSSGQCLWILAVNNADANSMALNPMNGELIVAGDYHGAVSFGSTALPAPIGPNDQGMFVARLSQAGQWTSTLGARTTGSGDIGADEAVVGPQGQVAVAVAVRGGSATLGSTTINATSGDKQAVAQLTPAGQWQWVTQSSTASSLEIDGLQYDASGNVWMSNTTNAGGQLGTITLPTNTVGFVGRLSTVGAWNLVGAVTSQNGGVLGGGKLAVDAQGNAVLAGTINADPSASTVYSFGTRSLSFSESGEYVARFNTNGQWQYAIKPPVATGGGRYSFSAIAFDQAGSLLTMGNLFGGSVTFGSTILTGSSRDIFVAKLNSAGSTLAVRQAAGAQPLALYPNPVTAGTAATLRLAAPAPATQPVTLRNTLGQIVRQTTITAGNQEAAVPTTGLAPGVYLLEAGISRTQVVVH
ncbi:T9SS type A sorting domain-containing protein [Hymenobacter elongatus]|uniref:T9SS type A sorting domain-containing protein n=1 Tax=Hymenobacter elongatus TaxID=877208 RepID=A0A4Z0PK96_9BACT|nr:T9SS type A sorting domain-containing protein [Hymenobacter elongatus]TGE15805.1 T9SS type A sorting domain-containing protein [Hymenobacter elongatus]